MNVNQNAVDAIFLNLSTIFNKALTNTTTEWQQIAMEVPSNGRYTDHRWLGSFPAMKEWIGKKNIKKLDDYEYVVKNKGYESTIEVLRDDIEDDQLGIYAIQAQNAGDAAKKHPDQLVFTAVNNAFKDKCFDGQAIVQQTKLDTAQNKVVNITPIDLAVIRQQVRTDIQQAIVAERAITQEQATISNIDPAAQVAQYKVLATTVHDQIQALIETRPPIRTTPILLHCTAHWLAHQLYGDMNRAEEIKRLNPTVLNFALVQTGTELITYAR
ncbi:Mu-like prophage major head subunit gpT family protein [Acinetobacter piscicola]|uniref:Mu-like prophage major head subunit gpT family protein n=1 Tax=Acinetobacter piscicola TaxID=2006115 RepID=UPI00101F456E|nr:Mu-like prophage major head subunit gpT family protein [Acinetobacter piscicola]RYL25157.1 hypothetical protein EWP19_13380 [Acinetobacter piscicola]